MTRSFRFTPRALAVIQRHARGRRSASSIAAIMGCETGTIENICRKHGVEISPRDGDEPEHMASRCPLTGNVDPLLNPNRRRARNNLTAVGIEIAGGALSVIEREAARRGTTSPILIARIAELVAQDGLFLAVLDT